jgi:type I restriction enzyme S subunit
MSRQSEDWASVPLKDLGYLGRGKSKHRPRNDPSLYGGKYPFVQTGDVTHTGFWLRYHSQTYSDKGLAQSKLWPAGTLCITIAANIAETAVLTMDACFPDSIVGFIANPARSDTSFIKYSLDYLKQQYKDISRGTTQDNLSLEKLNSIQIKVPSVVVQEQISTILRTYDDMIEVNQRRIAILESMTRRLFDEWFVRFRYPGHDAVPLVETALGLVPEGWVVVRAEEMIDFDPRTKVPKAGIKRFVPMGSLDTVTSVISDCETRSGNSGSKFQNGDTLFARITPCLENGKTGLVNFLEAGETAFGSTEFTVMRGKGIPSSFVYLLARSDAFRAIAIKSMGGADGRQRVRTEALKGYELTWPSAELLSMFACVAEPSLQQVRVLANQNARLRAARDLLLPKLISGEIAVSAAEDTFAEAAE